MELLSNACFCKLNLSRLVSGVLYGLAGNTRFARRQTACPPARAHQPLEWCWVTFAGQSMVISLASAEVLFLSALICVYLRPMFFARAFLETFQEKDGPRINADQR
jgi:hypothetical protein